MKPEELKSMTYGHHCLDDEKLAEIENARNEAGRAEPGDWRVRDGRVVRYGTWTPVVAAAALHFLAMCFTWVPKLIRCVRALEDALRLAWIQAAGARRELAEERERHAATAERAARGETGPLSDLEKLIEAAELGAFQPTPGSGWSRSNCLDGAKRHLQAWAGDMDLADGWTHHLDSLLADARKRRAEDDALRAEERARFESDVAVARALIAELKLTKAQCEATLERARKKKDEAADELFRVMVAGAENAWNQTEMSNELREAFRKFSPDELRALRSYAQGCRR